MDFSSKNKSTLKKLAEELEVDVPSRKKNKPTMDELVAALETKEQEDPEAFAEAIEKLGITDEQDTEDPDDEDEDESEEDTKTDNKKGKVFTYVGAGESSPKRINFMGRQQFKLGQATKVTDPELISKITGNPTFVEGKVDMDTLQDIEDEGVEHANRIRKENREMDARFKREHGGKE